MILCLANNTEAETLGYDFEYSLLFQGTGQSDGRAFKYQRGLYRISDFTRISKWRHPSFVTRSDKPLPST